MAVSALAAWKCAPETWVVADIVGGVIVSGENTRPVLQYAVERRPPRATPGDHCLRLPTSPTSERSTGHYKRQRLGRGCQQLGARKEPQGSARSGRVLTRSPCDDEDSAAVPPLQPSFSGRAAEPISRSLRVSRYWPSTFST